MRPTIHFQCRGCSTPLEVAPAGAESLACTGCQRPARLRPSPSVRAGKQVDACASCGHADMYIQKDFNRALGIGIVVVGVLASLILFARGQPAPAMLVLVAMAGIDAAIYFLIRDVTVCYACHTLYRGFPPNPEHAPFDLELLERYGGRDPRHREPGPGAPN